MQRKSLSSAVTLVALSLLLFLQLGSKADTLNRAATNGRFLLNGSNLTQFNVSAYKYHSDATGLTTLWGTLSVVGNSFAVSTSILSEDYYSVNIRGNYYKHAVVTSKPFNYYDAATATSYSAHMIVSLTQYGPSGHGGIQIISNSDGSVLLQSTVNGVGYSELPFTSGSVSII